MMSRFDSRSRQRSRSPIRRYSSAKDNNYTKPKPGELSPPNWNSIDLVKFEKCFYREHPICASRPQSEVDSFRMLHKMSLSGREIPRPILSFNELELPSHIINVILKNGWKVPTPIQSQGWPLALSGRDVVGIAQTGSGKTASFLVPALIHIAAQPRLRRNEGPICLILVPTRELAQQVLSVAQEFATSAGIRTMCFYGGSPRNPQLRELQRGAEICIATPGRLIDFIRQHNTLLHRVTYLVLDEADRMLDMGFEPQIRKILSNVRPDRQTLMWSATWPREVQALARDFLIDYIQVNIGSVSLHANPNITQIVEIVDEWRKEDMLVNLLTRFGRSRCLVFVETKRRADRVASNLKRRGFSVGCMHGNKQQRDREMTLSNFRDGRTNVLIATDVASRGLDIDDIEYVINMDFPNQTEDYIHRIGRTARSDKKGTAFTFFTIKNARQARELIEILEEAHQQVNPRLIELSGMGNLKKKSGLDKHQTAFQRKPIGHFTKLPQKPGYNTAAPNYQNQDLRTVHSNSNFQNSSGGLINPTPASGGLNPPVFNVGANNEPPYMSENLTRNTHSSGSLPSYGGSATSIKDVRMADPNFSKPKTTNYTKPPAPLIVPPTEESGWGRYPGSTDDINVHGTSMPTVPAPTWSSGQWVNKVTEPQTYWNPSRTDAYANNGSFTQHAATTARTGRFEQPPPPPHNYAPNISTGSMIPPTIRPRGSVSNINGSAALANPQPFSQPWPNCALNPYQQNLPVPDPPITPHWGPNWGPSYHGGY